MNNLPDIQNQVYGFPKVKIDQVGIKNIKVYFPVKVLKENYSKVLATFSAFCPLANNQRGINMSRLGNAIFEVAADRDYQEGFANLEPFAYKLMEVNQSSDVLITAQFVDLIDEYTPYTRMRSYKPISVELECLCKYGNIRNFITITTTETSLCPCSKEMSLLVNNLSDQEKEFLEILPQHLYQKISKSGYGAHNQNSEIKLKVELISGQILPVNDLLRIIRNSTSAPTYSILKRSDEKMVTEIAYMGGYWDNDEFIETGGGPRFVEDTIREICIKLNQLIDQTITNYEVEVTNYESIHCDDMVATAKTSTYC